ncbi:sigma-54-dependent transcriptional regulator [Nitrospirillum viridazoti]|uniref:Sigma-54-dependent Fis family transcriptional regulator n=1 Tax=Nitrospirillum viridazoti CBAmc TaxID=1441467 RepID=A0A248JS63_9PROT|nr:sigma-54 dependent transcriptional regulator [Nitrospirillum amazonense]ASG20928.1 sigma-54-dependent Fis family transcriptional regulator [Nitrospirillum amazonense CBAmc]TWB37724.1 DNA-binding NtrC family response regulator [Nitrospirillum amazonense]
MRLLIVGTLEGYITAAGKIALQKGAKVAHTDSIGGALNALRGGQGADLVMIDVKLDVAMLIEALKTERITVPVVACGVATDAQAAVKAIRAGAKEYIPLPPDAQLIAAVLEAVAEESHAIVSRDPSMGSVLRLADQIAPSDASVLITGESGTGKELMARYIHRKSRRANAVFVSVNCAAIPENLLESELFGHEKGAFTGAVARRVGKFEEANGGTLLLDEISEMDIRLQAKLLRAIQEREIDRVGGTQPVKVDIRVLATSNRFLEEEVRAGRFREDLFFRLNVVNLILPPLRERPADIAILSQHFATKYSEANGLPERRVSPEAMAMLQAHRFRGNVRELENTMHRAVLLSRGTEIGTDAILLTGAEPAAPAQGYSAVAPVAARATAAAQPAAGAAGEPGASGTAGLVGRSVADVERDLIIDTLSHCLGNRTHAANILGISIRTLRNKLKQYSDEGVAVPPPAGGELDRAAM